MGSTFKKTFLVGLVGCLAWFWYVVLFPANETVDAAGAWAAALTVIGLAGWLFEKAQETAQTSKAAEGASTDTGEVAASIKALANLDLGKIKRKHWVAAAVLVLAGASGWSYMRSAKEAEENLAFATGLARTKCASWMNIEFNSRNTQRPAKATGSWQKNGHIVVEVVWPESSYSNSLTSRLCVYDPSTGQMSSPGAFGRGRWEKK